MGLKLGFLRFFRHKPAKKERQKEDVIAEAKQKLASPENQESSHFFALVKQFFSLFFRIKYNFDYTELSSEIQKRKLKKEIKESAASFLQRLQDFEYGGESKPEELGVLIRDFEALVSQLEIKEETEEKKPVQLAPADRARSEKLAALLKEAGSCLDNTEFDRAGGLYRDITRSFEMLGVEQKRRYYNSILKLHNQLALYYESKKPVETARPEEAIYRARETVQAQKQSVRLPIGNFLIFLAGIIENAYSKALKSFSWLRNRFVFSVQFLRNLPQRYKSRIYSKNLSSVKSSLEQAKVYSEIGDYAGLRQLYGKLASDFEKLNVDDKRLHYNKILWLHRQIKLLPSPAPARMEAGMPAPVEVIKPKAEIPHPEILLKPVFSAVANAFRAAWNSAVLAGIRLARLMASLLPVLKSAYTQISGTVKAFSGAAASSFLKLAGTLAFFEKRTFASISGFVKNLSALPAKYSEYAYNKKLSAVKNRIEKANICAEAGNYSGLRRLYAQLSSDFKKLRAIFAEIKKSTFKYALSLPERYRESAKKRNIGLLSRMISEARKELEENDVHGARSRYKRIGAFFNRLPKGERLGAYRNIVEIHRKITILSEKASTDKRLARIDCLLAEAETHITQMDIRGARRLYGEINRLFEGLPAEEKKLNYGRIIKMYDRILSLYRPKTS